MELIQVLPLSNTLVYIYIRIYMNMWSKYVVGKDLFETLILGIEDKRIWMEEKFWDELRNILEDLEADDLADWFLKVLNYLDKQKKSDSKRKRKKLTKLFRDNPENVLNAVDYFNNFLTTYDFKQELLNFITSFIPDLNKTI